MTCTGVADGCWARYSAAEPATCGDAMDVPLSTFVAVSPVSQSDRMLAPGAKMPTQEP